MSNSQFGGMYKYMQDVLALDDKFGLNHLHEPKISNLGFFALALGGESGELQNIVKKIWRDGETPELWERLAEEAVDILIYLLEIINVAKVDFDRAWTEKHRELYGRFADRAEAYRLDDRDLNISGSKEAEHHDQ